MKGPYFTGPHGLFYKAAEEIEEFINDIAERAVELVGVALGTIQVVEKQSGVSTEHFFRQGARGSFVERAREFR